MLPVATARASSDDSVTVICTSGFVNVPPHLRFLGRVAKRAYSQIDSPEGGTTAYAESD